MQENEIEPIAYDSHGQGKLLYARTKFAVNSPKWATPFPKTSEFVIRLSNVSSLDCPALIFKKRNL
jgi:hypothetical protein